VAVSRVVIRGVRLLQHGRGRSARSIVVGRARGVQRPDQPCAGDRWGALFAKLDDGWELIGRPIVDFLAGGPTLSITVFVD
jgi:hypothetical protein